VIRWTTGAISKAGCACPAYGAKTAMLGHGIGAPDQHGPHLSTRDPAGGADLLGRHRRLSRLPPSAIYGWAHRSVRLPKFDYFMFQSQRPAEAKPATAGSGPMVFIATSEPFNRRPVTVFSNCDEVRLTQNGKLIGHTAARQRLINCRHPPFTFKVGNFSARTPCCSRAMLPRRAPKLERWWRRLDRRRVAATHVVRSGVCRPGSSWHVDACGVDPLANGADWVRVYAHRLRCPRTTLSLTATT